MLVDGHTEDGELFGRSQWDAPDIDPIVFLLQPEEGSSASGRCCAVLLGLVGWLAVAAPCPVQPTAVLPLASRQDHTSCSLHSRHLDAGIPPLEVGQMRRCKVLGTSIFDLEATPVA